MRLAAALLALSLSGCTLGQARWAYVSGAAADLGTTQAALNSGLSEANPIMGATGEPVLWSAVGTAATIGVAEWAGKHDPKGALWFYRVFAAYRWTLAALNLHEILTHDDKPSNELEINRRRKVANVAVRVTF